MPMGQSSDGAEIYEELDDAGLPKGQKDADSSTLEDFVDLVASIKTTSGKGPLACFEEAWEERTAYNHCSWRDWRDGYGSTALMMLIIAKHSVAAKAFEDRGKFCERLGLEMIDAAPHLVTGEGCALPVHATQEPFLWNTALHLAAANSDVPLFEKMLDVLAACDKGGDMLNAVANGLFWRNMVRCPSPHPLTEDGLSVLDAALVGPIDDDICLTLVRSLAGHGARMECFDSSRNENGTVLHRLAKCAWEKKKHICQKQQADHMSPERIRLLMDFFLDGEETQPIDQSITDQDGYTAIELAAILGNDVALVGLLQKQALTIWEWGHKSEVRLPLEHIDCGSREQTQASVMELLALYKHTKCQTLGIFVDLIEKKWQSFGRKLVVAEFLTSCTLVVLVTVGSLGDTSASHNVRFTCRVCTMVLTFIFLCYVPVMIWLARDTEWIRRMAWWPSCGVLDIWQIGSVRNISVMIMVSVTMAIQLVQHELQFTEFHEELMDALNAVLVFLMWMTLVRFLALFEQTGVMVDALPRILFRDMFPWAIVYMILLLASASAMRIAVKHSYAEGTRNMMDVPVTAAPNDALGSFGLAMFTLLESTFGPDVHFQDVVRKRPLVVAIFFLGFLWLVSITLLNLLIAMFSDTFEEVRAMSFKEMIHRRAVEMINHEKLMPLWIYKRYNLATGTVFVDEYSSRGRAMSGLSRVATGRSVPSSSKKATETTSIAPRQKRWLRMYQTFGQCGWSQFHAQHSSDT